MGMKIVEAISDTNIGGAGILLLTRLKHSDRARFFYHVILPRGSALKERLKAIDVTVWELDACRDRSFSLIAIFKYISLLQYLKPDLVNCHGVLSCRIAAALCRVPCRIYTRHCAYPPKGWQTAFPGKWLLGRAQNALSTHTIAVAEAAKENLTQMGSEPERIRVIINGVEAMSRVSDAKKKELRDALRIPQDAGVVGICARVEPCKGHQDLLRAAECLLAKSQRYRFLIVGSGSLDKELREWSEAHGLASYVIFTGFAEDVFLYFNIIDINVNCSVGTETSSLALSEGMSLGIPAVASDYGGNPYMVRHGENGLIYPQRNADALAHAIATLAENPDLYRRLSQGARKRFDEELNAEHMTKETEQLYEELFGKVKDRAKGLPRQSRSKERSHRRWL